MRFRYLLTMFPGSSIRCGYYMFWRCEWITLEDLAFPLGAIEGTVHVSTDSGLTLASNI